MITRLLHTLFVGMLLVVGLAGMRPLPTFAATVSDCPTTESALSADIANAGSGGTVAIASTCTNTVIPFDSAHGGLGTPITITQSVTLDASGASETVTLDGGNQTYLFLVNSGITFTLKGLTLAHGTTSTSSGGAIVNDGGTLTITNSTLSGNSAPNGNGGAIYNLPGSTLSVSNSRLSNNSARIFGGAIANQGTLTISNSTLAGNSASTEGGGGAIDNSGILTITNSTLAGNSYVNAPGGGGAIVNVGTANISNSTVSGNVASVNGGAIANVGGSLSITDSTLSGNSATNGGAITNEYRGAVAGTVTISNSTLSGNSATGSAPNGAGGAIFSSGTVIITNSTLSSNTASRGAGSGGALYNWGMVKIGGSIIANGPGANCVSVSGGTIADLGYNLEDTAPGTCGFSPANHDLVGQNPQLASLTNNGGLTQTVAPGLGSPAIDVIPTSATFAGTSSPVCPATDQRGAPRPDKGETACEIGAYEYVDPLYDCPTTESALSGDISTVGPWGTVAVNCTTPTTIPFDSARGGSGSPITITQSVTLDASGASRTVTFDGGGQTQLFVVDAGVNLILKGLTLAHGTTSTSGGGAIVNDGGTLTITNSTFSGNSTGYAGGAIDNNGTVTISNSTLSGNSAIYGGGAIYSFQGTLSITNSTLSGNSNSIGDGAILNDGTATISDSTLSGNSGSQGDGGAVVNYAGMVTISNSTLSGNSSTYDGGAIDNQDTLSITNSTVSGNSGRYGGGIVNWAGNTLTVSNSTLSGNSASNGIGGAIYNFGTLTISNSTLSGNSTAAATGSGGALYNYRGGTVSVGGSIIANSTGGNCAGPISDKGYNLEDASPSTCGFSPATHDIVGQNPLLDPNGLQSNGGPTQTIALQPGSPAIDAIPTGSGLCPGTGTDQRGITRPDNGETACDIGAYEYTAIDTTVLRAGVVGTDNQLYSWQPGTGFTPLGGGLLAAPAVGLLPGGSGQSPLALYVGLGTDHNLYVRSDTQGWQPLTTAPTYCLDNPALLLSGTVGNASITVACQGGDHGLWTASGSFTSGLPTVGGWSGLGGGLKYGPAMAPVNGVVTYFVIGTDSTLYSRTAGSGWAQMPWQCSGHPAVATSGSVSYLACQGLDRALYYATNTGSGWTAPTPAGGALIDGPGIAATASGATFFVEGTDNGLYQTSLPAGGTATTGFTPEGGAIRFGVAAAGL